MKSILLLLSLLHICKSLFFILNESKCYLMEFFLFATEPGVKASKPLDQFFTPLLEKFYF